MLEITLTLLIILAAVWFLWRWKYTSFFSDLGIPGPSPNLLFGNIIELYSKGPLKCQEEWVRKYGRILGYYYGMKRILLVADPQMLKNIYIKDFSKFTDREPFYPLFCHNEKDALSEGVIDLKGQKWKEIRSILTSTFTAAKMKRMAITINDAIETTMKILRENAIDRTVIDIQEIYQRLALDIIGRIAFGLNLDVQTNPKSKVLKASYVLLSIPFRSIFIFIGLCFPLLRRLSVHCEVILLKLRFSGEDPFEYLRTRLKHTLKYRREHPEYRKNDILQVLMDARFCPSRTKTDLQKLEAGGKDDEKEEVNEVKEMKKGRKLLDDEIMGTSFDVLSAGYDTTSTALTFTSYLLAKYPNVQKKLHDEIDELVKNGYKLEYSTVNKLRYLEKVLNESMRLYAPGWSFTNRYAVENVQYGELKIPKGTIIQAPTFLLHHDPDYWADPEVFDPERFNSNPNSDGMIFFPFGIGPRNCLGKRLAQMETKLTIAHIIYNFKLHLDEDSMGDFPLTIRTRTISPTNGVKIKLEIRNKDDV